MLKKQTLQRSFSFQKLSMNTFVPIKLKVGMHQYKHFQRYKAVIIYMLWQTTDKWRILNSVPFYINKIKIKHYT